ncbi:MAG: YeiH family protein, partial [Bdellovibrionota bacterium]
MDNFSAVLIPLLGAVVLLVPMVTSPIALFLGIAIAIFLGNPLLDRTKKITTPLLQASVVGLGAGMNLQTVARAGLQGVGYTIIGIATTLLIGTLLGRVFRITRDASLLVTVGTAICGGSAIAAVASTVRAKQQDISVALGTVFILNATALVIFPWIGHQLALSETQFGLWAALAIHDTSSVVGATMSYGRHALEVGTTVKLARALWIVPVALGIGLMRSREKGEVAASKAKRPWFILGFLVMAALVTWIPQLETGGHYVEFAAKRS